MREVRKTSSQGVVKYQELIDSFYGTADSELKTLLLEHSRAVADKALRVCDAHPEFHLDRDFVEAAAMLHDIGIIRCNAPGIHCHGTEPYIRHGLMGAQMLKDSPLLARVCQRHTGAGIRREEILAQQLPLPLPADDSEPYMPESMEEKLICYADKFFSKTSIDKERTKEEVVKSMEKFGPESLRRIKELESLFG